MPWYKSGTVSVALNSNAVIGTGTAFIANSRVGDAFRGPDGGWYEVTNIASDTALSISPNYQGATAAAGAYALAPMQGYVKDSADTLRSFVNLYGTKLAALGTTGNYDILPVNKGGTGAATQASAQAALGLVPTTGPGDTTAGRLLKVGDFGLGSTDLPDYAGNLNTLNATGFYVVVAAATNKPAGETVGMVIVSSKFGSYSQQTYYALGTTTIYQRASSAGIWTPWRKIYNQESILGTVSQVSGIPTGAVIEFGSNANGWYIRFADGTQICAKSGTNATVALTSSAGALFSSADFAGAWPYPIAFQVGSVPVVSMGYVQSSWYGFPVQTAKPTATLWPSAKGISVASTTANIDWSMIAIGRWF